MVRLKPDRMRSKVTGLYQPMVKIGSFDLISQPLRAASFSSRRSLSSEVRGWFVRVKAPPTRREAALCKFLRIKFVGVPPPLQAPSLASLKSHFHPQIVSLTFKVPSLFGGADVLIYRHKDRRGRGEPMPGKDLRMSRRHIPVTGL